MTLSLENRVALVTGAGRGIGRAIALEFARRGAAVVVNDKSGESVVCCEIQEFGGKASCFKADVSDFSEAQNLVKFTLDTFGDLHILVNNAGITRDGLILTMSEQDWDSVIAVNLKGTFNCSKAAVKHMIRKHYGRIISITSVVGASGNAGQANYAAAKAGIIGLTKSAAKELASRSITVNAVAPGFIATAMTEKLDAAAREAYIAGIPLKRAGTPEDVANACLFLASELASYVTGQVLRVDGGLLM